MEQNESPAVQEHKLTVDELLQTVRPEVRVFEKEITNIMDYDIRNTLVNLLDKVPDYFWHVAASSTGKYHPDYALGEGGLVRHTKAAADIAIQLFTIYNFTIEEQNYILSAILLHDTLKHGEEDISGYTRFEHPIVASEFISKNTEGKFAEVVPTLVASHMGQWTTSKYSKVVLPAPANELQFFVHLCDYLASRKMIEVKFD